MKQLNQYIIEKFKINSKTANKKQYSYYPKTKMELIELIIRKLNKDKNADLNDIDVSEITNMKNLFSHLYPKNIDISEWNVSNVTNFSNMFMLCSEFNCDLSKWDISNATDLHGMFYHCNNFNSNLTNWKLKNNKVNIDNIFRDCTSLEEKNKPSWYNK